MLSFACISPHAPILLPSVGSPEDRQKVKKTIQALEKLGQELDAAKPEAIIISSPHPNWGFNVPLHFLLANSKFSIYLAKPDPALQDNFQSISNFKFQTSNSAVLPFLTTFDSPKQHFLWGKELASKIPQKLRWAWIASGDMSHRLKEDGPYGFHPSGPKFDQKFIELLKDKDISGILDLDSRLVEEAGECGLRSFCMLLGAIEESQSAWTPKILSYEGPFGVGYLVARLV